MKLTLKNKADTQPLLAVEDCQNKRASTARGWYVSHTVCMINIQ